MREIEFRGKATPSIAQLEEWGIPHENGWVFGNLISNEHEYFITGKVAETEYEYISFEWWVTVDKNTIGQYLERIDKHGKKIYEGDIVHILFESNSFKAARLDEGYIKEMNQLAYYGSERLEVVGKIYDHK